MNNKIVIQFLPILFLWLNIQSDDNKGSYNFSSSFKKAESEEDALATFNTQFETLKSLEFSHNPKSAEYKNHQTLLHAFDKSFKKLLQFNNSTFVDEGRIIYSNAQLTMCKKIITGPFWGENKNQKVANEVRAISEAERLLLKGISGLNKDVDVYTNKLCVKAVELEIEKALLYYRLDEVFNRPEEGIPEEATCLGDCEKRVDGTKIAIDRFNEFKNKGTIYNCIQHFETDIDSLIQYLES